MSAVHAALPGASALDRLGRTQRALSLAVMLRTALVALAALSALVALLAAADFVFTLHMGVRIAALAAAALLSVQLARRAWLRGRAARSSEAVALWIEERVPALNYALATLADTRLPRSAATPELERIVSGATWTDTARRAIIGSLLRPLAVLLLAIAVLAALPNAAVTRALRPRAGDVLDAAGALRSRRSILSPLVAVVTPPAYTGRTAVTLDEPVSVGGIAGSDVVVEGRGDASRIRASLGDSALPAGASGAKWRVRFRMPPGARALRLADGTAERLVTIEPWADSAPFVQLVAPRRDTVFRSPEGTVELAADISDDLGIAEARFEYIVTSGEMEAFTFRTGVLSRVAITGARTHQLRGALSLASIALKAGDIVHLRALATDANTVTGPGRGASETRTLRIARVGEYDSIAVEGLPSIMGDTAALSQRMLIMLAEALERRRPRLARDTVIREARSIAVDQARLRRRVADIVFMRISGESSIEESEGGEGNRPNTPEEVLAAAESLANQDPNQALDFAEDESPVVAINRPLLEAYNAMWEAGRWLEIGEPDDALPHMRAAMAAIQRARQAERLYLRGRPATQVVDIRDARLKGEPPTGVTALRLPSTALGIERTRLAGRLAAAATIARSAPGDAADTLLLMRLAALGRYPQFAAAVGRAAARLRAGEDATAELLRARDALLGDPRHGGSLPAWSAAP